jgi:alanine-synthesizing transaminase
MAEVEGFSLSGFECRDPRGRHTGRLHDRNPSRPPDPGSRSKIPIVTIRATAPIPVASRVSGFVYAIRNIVAEARKVEASGRKVRYLNIGDPVIFGFQPPPHLIEAVERAVRDGHNGYAPSVGIVQAREAIAAECERRGMPVSPDRAVVTAGTSEGIELALTALAGPGDEVLIPVPTYPLYTAVLAKIGAKPVFYNTEPSTGWVPDPDEIRRLVTPATRALVVIDPNNPTGASYPVEIRQALLEIADECNIPLLADEVYADLAFDGPVDAIALQNPDAPVITFSSLSKAYLAPGWRTGWLAVGRTERLDDVLAGIKKLADGRLCSSAPMEYALIAALNGDRTHQQQFRDALRERADVTTSKLNAIDGLSVVRPAAAFYAMPKVSLPPGVTDEDYVLGLLRETGVLCVYGSGFGAKPEDGYFRVVFLASPGELSEIYGLVGDFTKDFLQRRA